MRLRLFLIPALIVLCIGIVIPTPILAQDDLPRLGVGAKVSTLGIGIEAATAVTRRSNVRGSFNFYDYNRGFDDDGINYAANLRLRSVQVMYDQYIIGGVHISPGLLLHNGNRASATASVGAGQTFSLGDVTFYSNTSDPVRGAAAIDFRNVSPIVLAGFGNLLPRNERRFGVNVDLGVVFQGSPNFNLNLAGTACAGSATTNCRNAATDPNVQNQIQIEQGRMNDDLKVFKYYPVMSVGVSWKF